MLSARQAPPTIVPLRFLLFGVACLLAASVWLLVEPGVLLGPYVRPHTVALAHLLVLGCATSICMGAMYPVVPVALDSPLHSVRLAIPHTILHLLGVIAVVPAFYAWEMRGVATGGGLILTGAVLLTYNLARTLARTPRFGVVAGSVATTLAWMLLAMALGIAMAISKLHPLLPGDPMRWLHAHAHLGVLGIFVNLILGVSLKLLPMFVLADWRERPRSWAMLAMLNGGLVLLASGIALGSRALAIVSGLLVAAGFGIYAMEIAAILRARRRAALDPGLITFLGALAAIPPTCALGFVAATIGQASLAPALRLAYAFAALFGIVIPAIVGMLYKILPFLVWHRVYGPRVGREPVPTFAQMVSPPLQTATSTLFLVALALLLAGILDAQMAPVAGGAALWLLGLLCFVGNVARAMRHWWRSPPPAARERTKP
ncbi:MAG: hypothetical protein IT577_06030 [Verrucomicrobiae bacterium]|nr:hypothetical protein [Verrucomicrobiae bacterium]